MKKLLFIAATVFSISVNAQKSVNLPVKVSDSTKYRFHPTNLILERVPNSSFTEDSLVIKFHTIDSSKTKAGYATYDFSIRGSIKMPTTYLRFAFDGDGNPIVDFFNQILGAGFGLYIDDSRQIKVIK